VSTIRLHGSVKRECHERLSGGRSERISSQCKWLAAAETCCIHCLHGKCLTFLLLHLVTWFNLLLFLIGSHLIDCCCCFSPRISLAFWPRSMGVVDRVCRFESLLSRRQLPSLRWSLCVLNNVLFPEEMEKCRCNNSY